MVERSRRGLLIDMSGLSKEEAEVRERELPEQARPFTCACGRRQSSARTDP